MPSLHVTKNGAPLCVVGSADVSTFSASVWADIWGPERSSLTVTGSKKSGQGEADEFLIWQLGHELKPGDRIGFLFTAASVSSAVDQSPIVELDAEHQAPDFFGPIPEAELFKLESRPMENSECKWRFAFPGKPSILLGPDSERQHCGLQLMWGNHRPDRLRINLSRSSLREISARTGGEALFVEYVPLEATFDVTIEA